LLSEVVELQANRIDEDGLEERRSQRSPRRHASSISISIVAVDYLGQKNFRLGTVEAEDLKMRPKGFSSRAGTSRFDPRYPVYVRQQSCQSTCGHRASSLRANDRCSVVDVTIADTALKVIGES
jgi:hypothetical protein